MTRLTFALAALATLAPSSQAAMFDIDFIGLDLVYDGVNIRDANDSGGDDVTVTIREPGGDVSDAITSPATLDVFLPGVGTIENITQDVVTSDPGGTIELELPDGEMVTMKLESVAISYVDLGTVARFAFGGAVAEVMNPSNPSAQSVAPPASVSFQATIEDLDTGAGVVNAFTARSTGTIRGATLIPEPATAAAIGMLALVGSAAAAMRAKLG